MKITHLHIEHFRSIRSIDLVLDDTTVFIGPNNSGKTAILEAVRIVLSRRWGQQGTGFSEDDVHLSDEQADPRRAPAVKIRIILDEPSPNAWPVEMVADLEDIMTITTAGVNRIDLSVTYSWKEDLQSFEPTWEFLDSSGKALQGRRRSINTSPFYNYLLFFWLGPLRDADNEFTARSRNWGGLLKTIQIPQELEAEVKATLDSLDSKLLAADPKFGQISKTVGNATEITAGEKPGAAKLRMLPLEVRDLIARAGIVIRNEDLRPWLPLDHHGQGLQSLSVIFLLQAAVIHRLSEEIEGAEAVFAIEEPEVHLHPQAARTLWTRIEALPGQKLVTTHSPHFVQNVPLHNLRIVRFQNGSTQVAFLPRRMVSELPWTVDIDHFVNGQYLTQFSKDPTSGCIASTLWFADDLAEKLIDHLRKTPGITSMQEKMNVFRRNCRVLVSEDEESELSFMGRRVRGEIFFAREWLLVEGPSEFLLLHAIGRASGYELDQHGISVIDFQNNGNAGIYPALADAFGIPWRMATDGDAECEKFQAQLVRRGYVADDLKKCFATLTKPNDLEDQLLADGHETVLRQVLVEIGVGGADRFTADELKKFLKNRKTAYMARFAPLVAADAKLAARMPKPYVAMVEALKLKYNG